MKKDTIKKLLKINIKKLQLAVPLADVDVDVIVQKVFQKVLAILRRN